LRGRRWRRGLQGRRGISVIGVKGRLSRGGDG